MNGLAVAAGLTAGASVAVAFLVREPWRRLASAARHLGELRGRHQIAEAQVQQLARELARARSSAQATAGQLYAIQQDLADAVASGALARAGIDVRALVGRMLEAEAASAAAAAAAAAGLDDAVPPGGRDAGDDAASAAAAGDLPGDARELLGRGAGDGRGGVDTGDSPADAGHPGSVSDDIDGER